MSTENKEVTVVTENGTAITEHGEIVNDVQLALKNAKRITFNADAEEFVHVRNDCSAGGGWFKVGDKPLCQTMSATFIDAQVIFNVDPFVKKGEQPKPTDWVQILFVDNKYGNLKSTLIKTRSISNFKELINQAAAVNENLAGMNFEMSFDTGNGVDEDGKSFKYKFLVFKRLDAESQYKEKAEKLFDKLNKGELFYPVFYR